MEIGNSSILQGGKEDLAGRGRYFEEREST
jgi:hypothetical protein